MTPAPTTTSRSAILLRILLPVLVIGLAGWWYFRLPTVAPAEFPSGWTSGGESWDAEWRTVEVDRNPARGEAYLLPWLATAQSVYVQESSRTHPGRLTAFDLDTGSTNAQVMLPPSCGIGWDGPWLREQEMTPGQWPTLRWRDPESLEVVQELQTHPVDTSLSLTGVTKQHYQCFRTSAEELTFFLWIHRAGLKPESQILRLSCGADGALRPMTWKPPRPESPASGKWLSDYYPPLAPTRLLLQSDADPGERIAYDLLTGARVAAPPPLFWTSDLVHAPDPTSRLRHQPVTRQLFEFVGWSDAQQLELHGHGSRTFQQILGAGHPRQEQPRNWGIALIESLEQRRLRLWKAQYGEDGIQLAGVRGLRIDEVGLRDRGAPSEHLRLIGGDLATVCSTQLPDLLRERYLRSGNPDSLRALLEPAQLRSEVDTSPPKLSNDVLKLHSQQLPNGDVLIDQVIADPPDAVTEAPYIWRLGRLPAGSTEIAWIGWTPVPGSTIDGQPIRPREVRYYRVGDRLLITTVGAHTQFRQVQEHHDLHWTTIPLPDACRDLGDFQHVE